MIFIQHNDNGQILQVVERTTSPQLSAGMKDISTNPLARQVANNPDKYFIQNGRIIAKHRVNLLPEKLSLKADGKDIARIRVETECHEPITLKVGLKTIQVLPNTELEVTSDSLGIITISLDDIRVWGPSISLFAEGVHEN